MLSLILIAALNTAAPPADKPPQRSAGAGCSGALQLAADAPQPAQPAPCPKPYLMAWPGAEGPAAPPRSERTPNFYRPPAHCGPVADAITRRIDTAAPTRRMAATLAVVRTVDGCGVPTPINYHPDYLLPGPADPVRPGDAPAGRR